MKRSLRAISLALGLGAALTAGAALGQQPPPPQPQPVPPTRLQAPPGGQPGQPLPIQRIDPSQLPPSLRQPGGPFGPGGRPGLPPGLPGQPGANPRGGKTPVRRFRPAPPPEPEESGGGHEEEEFCPGHGPTEAPPPPNWWRGILMVNNDLAQSPNPVNQLLFRYENKENPCDEKNQPPPFLATVLNFGILAFILYRFGRKPLAEALVKRKQAIMAEIDTATELLENAEGRLHDLEGKMDRMEETLADLRAQLAESAEEEKKHVLAEAEERRIRMIRDAEFRIEQELKSARTQLLQEAVEGAVAAAEQILAQRVGQGDLDRLADDYLSSVGTAISAAAPKAQTQGARS